MRQLFRQISWIMAIWIVTTACVQAQDSLFKQVKTVTSNLPETHPLRKKIEKPFKHMKDEDELGRTRRAVATRMAAQGYAEFSLDTFQVEGTELQLEVHPGPKYVYQSIEIEGLDEVLEKNAGLERMVRKQEPLDFEDLELRLKYVLAESQNNGYPLARLDSLDLNYSFEEDQVLTAIKYSYNAGPLIRIDSIQINGNRRESDKFVQSVIGIHKGDIFDQSAIDRVPRVLDNTLYFKNTTKPEIDFEEKTANLIIDLEQRKAGKFDVLLGLLPARDEQTKFEFTGLIDIQLASPFFRAGEQVSFRYDKLVGSSQKLNLQYLHPFILGTPLQAQGELDIQKQDTSFLNRYFKLSGYYAFSPNLSVKVWYKNKASSLISTAAFQLDSTRTPAVLDGSENLYGAGFSFQNLDYRFNPTKGIYVTTDIGIGRKKIKKNVNLAESIYTGLELNQPKTEAHFEIGWYQRTFKRLVLHLRNRTYWLDQKVYFENDMAQVGGSRSIRGFNENQFFTNFYTFFTGEYRFLLEKNSYLFVFGDYAYLENKIAEDSVLRPYGFGAGMTYDTKAGMISVTYAIGQVKNNPLQPGRGRIHIGLINQF